MLVPVSKQTQVTLANLYRIHELVLLLSPDSGCKSPGHRTEDAGRDHLDKMEDSA